MEMNVKEKLKKASELKVLIETTEEAVRSISEMKGKPSQDSKFYKDGPYNLTISEHRDGSGYQTVLSRYYGNGRLLNLIEKELIAQLEFFKSEAVSL